MQFGSHDMTSSLGGGALYVAAADAYFGGKPSVCAHIGPNVRGVLAYSQKIDFSGSVLSRSRSPEFEFHYDEFHAVQSLSFDEQLVSQTKVKNFSSRIPANSFIHFPLRNPYSVADLMTLTSAGHRVSSDVIVSSLSQYIKYLPEILDRFELFFCNSTEWSHIVDHLPFHKLKHVVVTSGQHPIEIWEQGECMRNFPVPPVEIIDPTGAGDAFTGGYLHGYLRGCDIETRVEMGIETAQRALLANGIASLLASKYEENVPNGKT